MNSSPVLKRIRTFGRWGKRMATFLLFCFAAIAVGTISFTSQVFAVPTDTVTITAEDRAEVSCRLTIC